jgi:hypothetical protein
MPQLTRHYCSNCKNSIYNTMIDGKRVPIVHYIVTGQAEDTGPAVDGKQVKLTSFSRESLQMPTARVELCEICFSQIFGLKLLTAEDDPMYSDEQAELTWQENQQLQQDPEVQHVDRHARIASRALLAVKVGRGAARAPKLPKPRKRHAVPPIPKVRDIEAA